MGADGNEKVCRAEIQVNQDISEEGMLFLGDLDDLDSSQEDDPKAVDNAYAVLRFDKIPTVKADAFFRKVYL